MALAAGQTLDGFPSGAASNSKVGRRTWAWRLFVGGVTAGGFLLLLLRFSATTFASLPLALALLTASLLLSHFKLRLPLWRGVSTISMACGADLAALMLFGADIAMLTASVSTFLRDTIQVSRADRLYPRAFTVASTVVSVQAAGLAWNSLGGTLSGMTLVPLAATTATYLVVNTAFSGSVIGLTAGLSPLRAWYWEFFWSAPSYFLGGVAAGVVSSTLVREQYSLLPLLLVPLFVSYRAYQLSLRRFDEERLHGSELKRAIVVTEAALEHARRTEAELAAEKDRLVLESSRLSVTVKAIGDGVIMVDRDGSVLLMNEEASRLAAAAQAAPAEGPIGAMLAGFGVAGAACNEAQWRVWNRGEAVRLVNDIPNDSAMPRVEVSGTPIRNAEGQVAGAVWVLRDVTHIARAEQERAKAARLESLGVLAGGLAHDFNNILTGVVGNLSLAQALVRPHEDAMRTRLEQVAAAAARARSVANQLLTFSKGGSPIRAAASISELVVECTRFVLSGSRVAPHFDIPDDVWAADIDTNQIAQVVDNLVLNALQAMPAGGRVDVSLKNLEITRESVPTDITGINAVPGRYVRLTVRDHGMGIPPEHLTRIFEPYFTTKEEGSGLGLAISYSIVRAHGGTITFSSQLGEGATLHVYLPASMRPVATATTPPAVKTRRLGGPVLLMDDDPMVADVTREMLESLGFETDVVNSGQDAVDRFVAAEQNGAPFRIVILDLTVQGAMGGADAIRHIRNVRADVHALVMSGYADNAVLAQFNEYRFDGMLPKPFALSDLRRALSID